MRKKLAIVQATYYNDISTLLWKGALDEIYNLDKDAKIISNISDFSVSGVFELPVVISKNINKFDAFIALGCVIKGETPHFDFISRATIDAIMRLSVEYKKPIGNGIITSLNKKQAFQRADVLKKNKGAEAARAVFSVMGFYNKGKNNDKLFSRNKRKS